MFCALEIPDCPVDPRLLPEVVARALTSWFLPPAAAALLPGVGIPERLVLGEAERELSLERILLSVNTGQYLISERHKMF